MLLVWRVEADVKGLVPEGDWLLNRVSWIEMGVQLCGCEVEQKGQQRHELSHIRYY